jgi:hypothetical protein
LRDEAISSKPAASLVIACTPSARFVARRRGLHVAPLAVTLNERFSLQSFKKDFEIAPVGCQPFTVCATRFIEIVDPILSPAGESMSNNRIFSGD